MKFACLIYQDEVALQKMPPVEMAKDFAEYESSAEEMQKSGKLRFSHGLSPTTSATTVRVRNGKTLITDGPFAETKEQLGGIFLIEATDLNDAIRVAAKIPTAHWGSIEIRPEWTSLGSEQ
jgi:hypothetical protein